MRASVFAPVFASVSGFVFASWRAPRLPSIAALVLGCALQVSCGGGGSSSGPGGSPPDMAIPMSVTMTGLVGGELMTRPLAHLVPDVACGARGLDIFLSEDADRGCAVDAASRRNLQIHLSDNQLATYLPVDSTACSGAGGARQFFATFHGKGGVDFVSLRGSVTITYYDATTIAGSYNITFAQLDTPNFDNGTFQGKLAAQHCP